MTGSNPPHDGPQDDSNQWWSTPASTGPGTPLTGTDPTILGGGQGYGTSGYAQNPYPQQPYSQPAPQPVIPSQPGYTGQQYTPGYAQPAYPTPPQRGSHTALWIIGGVVGLVVVIGTVIGVVVAKGGHADSGSILGKKKVDGNYAMTNVTNACSLVDLTVLHKWAPNPKPNPEHTERAPDNLIGGGSLSCSASYEGAGKYSTDGADLDLNAEFQGSYGSPDYNMWKDEDAKTTGSGRDSGTIAGIGEQSYYATYMQNYSSFNVLEYTCAALDSNVSVKVKLRIETDNPADKDDVGTTCKDQLKKVLTALHK